jgi:hypothetical protein
MTDKLDDQRDELFDELEISEADECPYCVCNAIPTVEEEEWNECMACGKPLTL